IVDRARARGDAVRGARVAMLISGDARTRGMAKIYQALTKQMAWNVEVFTSPASAWGWLTEALPDPGESPGLILGTGENNE
ncbi:hypothetical protein LCGC14_2407170, partial [marine sediment metagenome]